MRSRLSTARAYRPLPTESHLPCAQFCLNAINLLLLIPGPVGVKFYVQRGRQHLGRKLLGVISGGIFSFSERVVLTQIAVRITVRRNGNSNARRQQPVWFVSGILGYDSKDHLTRIQVLQSLRTRNQLALWRKNRRDANQILCGDAGISQRQLERSEALTMLADPLSEKNPLGDHVSGQFEFPPLISIIRSNIT